MRKNNVIQTRADLKQVGRLVVKVGTALLTNDGKGLDKNFIQSLADQLASLIADGRQVVLVSSGSIAAGVSALGLEARPRTLNKLQAAASVGQALLIQHYESAFKRHALPIAQILLTHADIANRQRYLNARNTLATLLDMEVITVVNENDTVATDEICFGDNDSLGALVCNLIDADLQIILTDQDGLYTADPRNTPDAKLIPHASAEDEKLLSFASGGGRLGRGGMVTKLDSAVIASRSGAATVIANGRIPSVLDAVLNGQKIGTLLSPQTRLSSKKQWMANQMKVVGKLTIDDGACAALLTGESSLLAIGVSRVEGDFDRGSLVSIFSKDGVEIARGLCNYNAEQVGKIIGLSGEKIKLALGELSEAEVVHRDHMVLL